MSSLIERVLIDVRDQIGSREREIRKLELYLDCYVDNVDNTNLPTRTNFALTRITFLEERITTLVDLAAKLRVLSSKLKIISIENTSTISTKDIISKWCRVGTINISACNSKTNEITIQMLTAD